MEITVHTRTPQDLADIEERLRNIAGGVRTVQTLAIKDASRHLKSEVSKHIRATFDIKKSVLDSRYVKNEPIRFVEGENPQATVVFKGEQIPLHKMGSSRPLAPKQLPYLVPVNFGYNEQGKGIWRLAHPLEAASARQLVTSPVTHFKHAFVAQMESGHIGIFERTGAKSSDPSGQNSDAIRELMADSVAQMVVRPEVRDAMLDDASDWYDKRLNHYIDAMLTGSLRARGTGRRGRR